MKIAAEPLLQYSPCSLDAWMAATYRHVNMKALARYQIILLGEQRHIGVNNLPKVVAWQCSGRESNPWPIDRKSSALTTTSPSLYYTTKPLCLLTIYITTIWNVGEKIVPVISNASVIAPTELRIDSVCCVGLSSHGTLLLHNPSMHWMRVRLAVTQINIGGQPSDHNISPFVVRPKVTIDPNSTESVKVFAIIFLALGKYNPEGVQKLNEKWEKWVPSSIRAVSGRQTVMLEMEQNQPHGPDAIVGKNGH